MRTSGEPRDDAELCAAWCAGEKAAGNELIRRYYKPLCDFVYGQVRYSTDAMLDVVQRTFETIVKKKHEIVAFRPYAYAVARIKLHEHWRQRPVDELGDDEETQPVMASSDETTASALVRIRDCAREEHIAALALRSLSLDDQILLALKDLVKLPGREIAEVLGQSHASVNGKINRARDRLRASVERIADDPSARASTLRQLESWLVSVQDKLVAARPDVDPRRFDRG